MTLQKKAARKRQPRAATPSNARHAYRGRRTVACGGLFCRPTPWAKDMGKQGDTIELIVGLGNPGDKYARTRHNAGFWFIEELARRLNVSLRPEKKFHGETARATIDGHTVQLLKPDTFMNLSGQAVQAISAFYKWTPGSILVVHDEIDLPPGTVRLKRGGGHGGNNGLRDICQKMGKDFLRLRVGVGRPTRGEVVDYVLGRPSPDDQIEIERALDKAHDVLPLLLGEGLEKAMHRLHSKPGERSVKKARGRNAKDHADGKADKGARPEATCNTDEASDKGAAPAKPAANKSTEAAGADVSPKPEVSNDPGDNASQEKGSGSLRDQLSNWFSGKR